MMDEGRAGDSLIQEHADLLEHYQLDRGRFLSISKGTQALREGFTRGLPTPSLCLRIRGPGKEDLLVAVPDSPRAIRGKPAFEEAPKGVKSWAHAPNDLSDTKALWIVASDVMAVEQLAGTKIDDEPLPVIGLGGKLDPSLIPSEIETVYLLARSKEKLKPLIGFLHAGEVSVFLLLVTKDKSPRDIVLEKVIKADKSPREIFGKHPIPCNETPYRSKGGGLQRLKPSADGVPLWEKITNFTCEITKELTRDRDGCREVEYELEVSCEGADKTVRMPAKDFESGHFPEHLGAVPRVFPRMKGYVQDAIKWFSAPDPVFVYERIGVQEAAGEYVYVDAGGALSQQGRAGEITVELPMELAPYRILSPGDKDQQRADAMAVLEMLEVYPTATIPLVSAIFRALYMECPMTLWLMGPMGSYKSSFVALAASFYGVGFIQDDRGTCVAAAWRDTSNAIVDLMTRTSGLCLSVDDYKKSEVREQVVADVVRSQGNLRGRARLTQTSQRMKTRSPAGVLISAGEEEPPGAQSQSARVLLISIKGNALPLEPVEYADGGSDMICKSLRKSQDAGREGAHSRFFCKHVMRILAEINAEDSLSTAREKVLNRTAHSFMGAGSARVSAMLNDVRCGAALVFEALSGDLDLESQPEDAPARERLQKLRQHAVTAIDEIVETQAELMLEKSPVEQFLDLVGSLLYSGAAHVVNGSEGRWPRFCEDHGGDGPYSRTLDGGILAHALGWKTDGINHWISRGSKIGVLGKHDDTEYVIFEPTAAFDAVTRNGFKEASKMSLSRALLDSGSARVEMEGARKRHPKIGNGARGRRWWIRLDRVVMPDVLEKSDKASGVLK